MKHFFALLLMSVIATAAWAETRYVSDAQTIYMRGGPGTKYKITRGLLSGNKVTVTGKTVDGWTPVQLSDGSTGYILARQLQNGPVAKQRLEAALAERDKLRAEVDALKSKLSDATSDGQNQSNALSKLREEYGSLEAQFTRLQETSRRAVDLDAENTRLSNEMLSLEAERDSLRAEVSSLRNNSSLYWFLAGGGVLLLGGIIGLILPKIKWRRRDSWSSL